MLASVLLVHALVHHPQVLPVSRAASRCSAPPRAVAPTALEEEDGRRTTRSAVAREEDDDWAEFEAWTSREKDEKEDNDWAEFEAWTNREKDDQQKKPGYRRPRWTVSSAGHLHDHFFSNRAASFGDLGAPDRLVANLAALGVQQPSISQASAYPMMIKGENCVVNYAAGTGKSLAYIAPLIQKLWAWEAELGRTPPGEVRAIIIVPTAELGQQVLETAREVASRSIRASIATGEHNWATQRQRTAGGLDLLVGTMGRLVALVAPRDREPSFSLRGTRALVVDEADSLYQGEMPPWMLQNHGYGRDLSGDFQEPPLAMWKWLRTELTPRCHTTLVTASLSEGVEEQMREDVEALRVVRGRGVHTTRPGVNTTLIDCSVPVVGADGTPSLFEAKLEELLHTLDEQPATDRTLILCNGAGTCDRLARALRTTLDASEQRVLRFHSSLKPEQRRAYLTSFREPPKADGPRRILVATGRASKGLSFSKGLTLPEDVTGVGHVVLFEYPPDVKAYIARVGSATRGPAPAATVTALAVGKQLSFAKAMLRQDEIGEAHRL